MPRKKAAAAGGQPASRQIRVRLPNDHWLWQLPAEARRDRIMAGLEIARVLQESIRDLRREMELMRGEIRALKEQVERTSVPALDFGDEVEEKQEKPRKTGRDILLENMDKFLDL